MGLVLSVTVQKLRDTHGHLGGSSNPEEGLEERFCAYLEERFPEEGAFGAYVNVTTKVYEFHVRFFHYGERFKGSMNDMYKAMLDFILDNFSFLNEKLYLELGESG